MKNLILLLIVFLTGCLYIPNKKIYATSLTPEWNVGIAANSSARVVSTLASTDLPNLKSNQKTNVSADFTLLVIGDENSFDCRKAREREADNIQVNFWFQLPDREIYTYTFTNNQAWLTSANGTRYHLQPTEYNSSKKVAYQTYNLNKLSYPQSYQYFKTPLLCEQLEGAVFELGGIYKDGVPLPLIKFRINHLQGKR
jgi:hypothetical protein